MELYIDKKRISEKLNDAFIHILLPVGMKLQVKEERERMEPEEGEEKEGRCSSTHYVVAVFSLQATSSLKDSAIQVSPSLHLHLYCRRLLED